MNVFSIAITLPGIIVEVILVIGDFPDTFKVVVKNLNGSQHIGTASAYIFLGAESEDLNKSPFFVWAAVASILLYIFALAFYKILTTR